MSFVINDPIGLPDTSLMFRLLLHCAHANCYDATSMLVLSFCCFYYCIAANVMIFPHGFAVVAMFYSYTAIAMMLLLHYPTLLNSIKMMQSRASLQR